LLKGEGILCWFEREGVLRTEGEYCSLTEKPGKGRDQKKVGKGEKGCDPCEVGWTRACHSPKRRTGQDVGSFCKGGKKQQSTEGTHQGDPNKSYLLKCQRER